jgi:hypothetical protein
MYMRKIGWDFIGYSDRVCFLSSFPTFLSTLISSKPLADKVFDYRPDSETSNSFFPPEAIHQLWKDPIITVTTTRSTRLNSISWILLHHSKLSFSEFCRILSYNVFG